MGGAVGWMVLGVGATPRVRHGEGRSWIAPDLFELVGGLRGLAKANTEHGTYSVKNEVKSRVPRARLKLVDKAYFMKSYETYQTPPREKC